MRKLPVLIAFLLVHFAYSQITVINTGTSEDLYSISKIEKNYLINGWQSYLGKCYGECNSVLPLTVPAFPNSNYSYSISWPDTNFLYLTASSFTDLNLTFWKSSDGGYNWTKKFDTVSPAMFEGATAFFDTLNGVCFIDNWQKIETINGLSTYSFTAWGTYMPVLAEVYGDSTVAVVACGGNCGLGISKDRGKTWLNSNGGAGGVMIYDVKFLNEDTIFAISAKSAQSNCSYLFRSFDGGLNFDYKLFCGVPYGVAPPPEILLGLCVKSKNEIYITARNGYESSGYYTGDGVILKTTDLGQTWTRFITPFKKHLNDMKFINDSIALVCGEGGLLFKWNTKTAIFTDIRENAFNEHSVNIYPNPIKDKLTLKCEVIEPEKITLSISNFLGQSIYSVNGLSESQEIDIGFLPGGVYFLRLQNSSGQRVFKILKE